MRWRRLKGWTILMPASSCADVGVVLPSPALMMTPARHIDDNRPPAGYDGAMIRFLFRFVGLLSLALAFIFLVYDGTKSIADQKFFYITSLESFWAMVHQNSLKSVREFAEQNFIWVWQTVVHPYVFEQPIWLVLGAFSIILILLGRKKRRLIGYARD